LWLIDDALSRAAGLVARGRDAFDEDDAVRLACEALIGRIGEAAERLSDDHRDSRSDVRWRDIIGARIVMDHMYHRIDYEIVWGIVARSMPELRDRLAADLEAARASQGGSADEEDRAHALGEMRDLVGGGGQVAADTPEWIPDTPRCGSTSTADGRPCRNPVSSPGQRCRHHA
jgi:uncharacterized protein with HEPN domain